jgi:hypothetical protein
VPDAPLRPCIAQPLTCAPSLAIPWLRSIGAEARCALGKLWVRPDYLDWERVTEAQQLAARGAELEAAGVGLKEGVVVLSI